MKWNKNAHSWEAKFIGIIYFYRCTLLHSLHELPCYCPNSIRICCVHTEDVVLVGLKRKYMQGFTQCITGNAWPLSSNWWQQGDYQNRNIVGRMFQSGRQLKIGSKRWCDGVLHAWSLWNQMKEQWWFSSSHISNDQLRRWKHERGVGIITDEGRAKCVLGDVRARETERECFWRFHNNYLCTIVSPITL